MAEKDPIEETLREGGIESEQAPKKREPVYQMMRDTRVAVSKHAGQLWKNRRDNAQKLNEHNVAAWNESIEYFRNTAEGYRSASDGNQLRNRHVTKEMNDVMSSIENVVFSNVTAIVPYLFSRNPDLEITSETPEGEGEAQIIEKLGDAIMHRQHTPGVNLKPKIKKAITIATLTNSAYAVVTYTRKGASTEGALEDLRKLSAKYEKAKTAKEIEDIEGQLAALEQTVDALQPSGPRVSIRLPWEVICDPAAREDDNSDANWIMYSEMIPWSYIIATYAQEKTKDGKRVHESIYNPTHILKPDAVGDDMDALINNFTAIKSAETEDHKKFGFDNSSVYEKSKYVKVWMVFDKITRRIFMYNDQDWSWPIWVWDDPYSLDGFFNVVPLAFYTSPVETQSKGEVSYYLDQADAINEINDETARIRLSARRNIVFNKRKIDATTVGSFISNPDNNTGIGVDLEDGEKIKDVIDAFLPPSAQYAQFFDKGPIYAAIERLSSTSEIMRGAQFKTNTTNDAVNTYNESLQTRLEEKIDSVEDFISRIMWMVLQLCIQNMDAIEVEQLIGQKAAATWRQRTAKEIRVQFSLRVVSGSTSKPNSFVKKKQATEVAQILGQFSSASPVALLVALKVMSRAFDEVVVTKEEWDMVRKSIEQATGTSIENNGGPNEDVGQIIQIIDSLPPEAKRAVGQAIAQGVPVEQVVQQVMQAMNGGGQPQQASNGNAGQQPQRDSRDRPSSGSGNGPVE